MPTDVFDLYGKVKLDTSEYSKALENADKSFSGFGDKIKAGLGVITATTTAAVGAGAAAVGKIVLAKKNVSNVTIAAGATTLVAGTDYTVDAADAKAGQITILDSTAVQAAIAASDDLTVTYDCAQTDMKVVKLFTETEVIGRLKFVSDNPTGTQCTLLAKRVSLTPSGDTAFIGDDWSTLSFSCECLKSSDPADANSPYIDIIMEG